MARSDKIFKLTPTPATEEALKCMEKLTAKQFRRATVTALNAAAEKVRTSSESMVRKKTGIPQNAFKEGPERGDRTIRFTKRDKASSANLKAEVHLKRTYIPAIRILLNTYSRAKNSGRQLTQFISGKKVAKRRRAVLALPGVNTKGAFFAGMYPGGKNATGAGGKQHVGIYRRKDDARTVSVHKSWAQARKWRGRRTGREIQEVIIPIGRYARTVIDHQWSVAMDGGPGGTVKDSTFQKELNRLLGRACKIFKDIS